MFEGMAASVVGKRVGNYVVQRALAQGGMGSVFLARHPALGRQAAVKFIGDALEATPEFTQRFLDEARVTASMRHQNIVDIFDFGELDGRLYYVMELLEGRDLSAVMHTRRRFSCTETMDVLEQMCRGLDAAHSVGVVHRDLKPSNVFVTRGDPIQIKLMDFGVAKLLNSQGDQTRHGQVIGTPRYMSPEQALGLVEQIGPRSDIYSLGTIAYEMLAGVSPFDHILPVMLLVMQVRDPVPPLENHVPEVPAAVARLIHGCLEKDPTARPASVCEILDRIAELRRIPSIAESESSDRRQFCEAFTRAASDTASGTNLVVTPEERGEASTEVRADSGARASLPVRQVLEVLSLHCPKDEASAAKSLDLRADASPPFDLLSLSRAASLQPTQASASGSSAAPIAERHAAVSRSFELDATAPAGLVLDMAATAGPGGSPLDEVATLAASRVGLNAEVPSLALQPPLTNTTDKVALPNASPVQARTPLLATTVALSATIQRPIANATSALLPTRAEIATAPAETPLASSAALPTNVTLSPLASGIAAQAVAPAEVTAVPAKTPPPAAPMDLRGSERASRKMPIQAAGVGSAHAEPAPEIPTRETASAVVPVVPVVAEAREFAEDGRSSNGASAQLTETDKATLSKLLIRMQKQRDFPAFVQHVDEVTKRADCTNSYSAEQLGSSILKDYALTAKLLRIINSTYASRFGGKIYSIQHAIVFLGFDRIRAMALSTSLFKVRGNKQHADRVTESAIQSVVSGEIARELHQAAGIDDPEQAKVCAMFRNLGRHLVLVYLPESFDQIVELSEREKISLSQASDRILGLTFEKLGVGIAQRWNLPSKMISAMALGKVKADRPLREVEKLAALADLSNQLCEVVSNASSLEACSEDLNALLMQHRGYLRLNQNELAQLFGFAQESAEKRYRSLFGSATKSSRFARTIAATSADGVPARVAAMGAAETAEKPYDKNGIRMTTDKEVKPRELQAKPQIVPLQLVRPRQQEAPPPNPTGEAIWLELSGIHSRISEALQTSKDVEPLFRDLLAKLAQYLGVARIILMRAAASRRELVVVGGFGDDIEGLSKSLRIPLQPSRAAADPFSQAFHARRDSSIDDAFAANVIRRMPQCYYEAIGSTRIAVLPCGVLGADPLLALLDVEPPAELPSRQQLENLSEIRLTLARVAPG